MQTDREKRIDDTKLAMQRRAVNTDDANKTKYSVLARAMTDRNLCRGCWFLSANPNQAKIFCKADRDIVTIVDETPYGESPDCFEPYHD